MPKIAAATAKQPKKTTKSPIDQTKLSPLERTIEPCEVMAIPAGATPKTISIKLPGLDGATVKAWWNGAPALSAGDFVAVQRRNQGGTQYIITGVSGGTASLPATHTHTLPIVGSPDYSTVEDAHTIIHSSGVIDGDAIYVTQVDATHIAVAAGQGLIRVSNSPLAQLVFCEWPAVASIAIPAGSGGVDTVRFVGIEYNAGVPQVTVRTTFNWNWYDDFPLARVSQDGTTLRILNAYAHAEDTANKTRKFLRLNLPFSREEAPEGTGGLVIGDVATRYLSLSAGNIWHGFNRYIIAAINTSGAGRFDLHYRNGTGGFTHVTSQQQWPNTQYDDGDGTLATMTNNRYACLWIYLDVSDGTLDVLYGRGEYPTETAAQAEAAPTTIPGHLQYHGKLLGRLIFQKSASAAALVQSVWATEFSAAGVTDHASLSNVTSDQHHAQSHTHSGDGSGTIALDAAKVSQLWESDGGAVAAQTDAAGNLTTVAGTQIYSDGGGESHTGGLHWELASEVNSHFRAGATTISGYAWAGAPFATPGYIGNVENDWLACGHSAAARGFYYISITNAASSWQNKALATRVTGGLNAEGGLRVDVGNDNTYFEIYADGSAGNATLTIKFRYRLGGGSISTISSSVVVPTYFTELGLYLLCYWDGANYYGLGYLSQGRLGQTANISGFATPALTAYLPAAGRCGLLASAAGAQNPQMFDFIKRTFT